MIYFLLGWEFWDFGFGDENLGLVPISDDKVATGLGDPHFTSSKQT